MLYIYIYIEWNNLFGPPKLVKGVCVCSDYLISTLKILIFKAAPENST